MKRRVIVLALLWLLTSNYSQAGDLAETASGKSQEISNVSADTIINNIVVDDAIVANVASWGFSLSLVGKKVSGYTDYHITFPISYYGNPGEGHSVLVFPTDGYQIDFIGQINKKINNDMLALEFLYGSNIIPPKGAMSDTDYLYISYFTPPRWTWSATTSDVRYSNYDIGCTVNYRFNIGNSLKLAPIIGFQTSHHDYEVVGLSGWWEWPYGTKHSYDPAEYEGVTVGTYQVDYHQMITGLIVESVPNKGLSLNLRACYLPYIKAKDRDDHILRMKESITDASGKGYQLEGGIQIEIHKFNSGANLCWGCRYGLQRITAEGVQIQKYYADSPDTDDDETGWTSDPIDSKLNFWRNNLIAYIKYNI